MTSYVTFWLTSLHAAFAGSDRSTLLYEGTAAASVLAVAWALMYRLANRRSATGAARRFEPGNDKHPSPSLR